MGHREIRVIIFHSNRLFCESLALILDQQKAISVVRAAAGLDRSNPIYFFSTLVRLVVGDWKMPGGFELFRRNSRFS